MSALEEHDYCTGFEVLLNDRELRAKYQIMRMLMQRSEYIQNASESLSELQRDFMAAFAEYQKEQHLQKQQVKEAASPDKGESAKEKEKKKEATILRSPSLTTLADIADIDDDDADRAESAENSDAAAAVERKRSESEGRTWQQWLSERTADVTAAASATANATASAVYKTKP